MSDSAPHKVEMVFTANGNTATVLVQGMKHEMTIEYLKYSADLNIEVDFGVNGAIDAIVTKWDLILFG